MKSITDILEKSECDIGINESGHGSFIKCLEFSCNNMLCHIHSILHDAYGRVYNKQG